MKAIIKQHFRIQRTRFERASLEFGLDPWVSYILIPIIFIGFSFVSFTKGELIEWTYAFPAVFVLYILSYPERLIFYRQIYSKAIFFKIRWIENFTIAIPFLLFMLFKAAYIAFFILLVLTVFISKKDRSNWTSIALPTPFYRFPFEFTSGFRFSWILIIGMYALIFISCSVDNEALGIFTVITLALTSTLYYQYPETEFFVWVHSMDSKSFIKHKIKIALGYTMLIVIPMAIIVAVAWPSYALWTSLGILCALAFIATSIVAKYTMYPNIFNLPLVIALSIALLIPPTMLVLFPFLYGRAIKNLKPILS